MPPSFVKPPRWAVNRALLEIAGKNLSRGLVNLLPYWDDDPTDLARDVISAQYGWEIILEAGTAQVLTKGVPTSRGMGWQNFRNADLHYIQSDANLPVATEWKTDWSEVYVVRLDTAAEDSGIRSFGTGDLLWFDYDGSAMRMGATSSAANAYGPAFHTTADNGTVYVIVATNDNTNTAIDIFVDGDNHISISGTVVATTDQRLKVGTRNTVALVGAMVTYARWNRVLTDTEIQQVSADPFILLRRDMAIPTVLATPSGGVIALTGTGSAASAGDSTITGLQSLTGAGAAASDGTGILSATQALTGTGGAASSGNGVLTAKQTLVASGSAASAGDAVLTSTQALQGVGTAASGGNASLSNLQAFTGTGGTASSGDATLSSIQTLQGSGSTASAGDATLSSTQALKGSGAAASNGAGIIAIGGLVALTGTAAAASDGNGTITSTQALQGTGSNASAGTSILTVFDRMVGAGGAVSDGDATLTSTQALTGTGNAASDGDATLTSTQSLVASGAAASDGTGILSSTQAMLGTGSNTSTGVAVLTMAGTTFWTDNPVTDTPAPIAFTRTPVGYNPVKRDDPTPW